MKEKPGSGEIPAKDSPHEFDLMEQGHLDWARDMVAGVLQSGDVKTVNEQLTKALYGEKNRFIPVMGKKAMRKIAQLLLDEVQQTLKLSQEKPKQEILPTEPKSEEKENALPKDRPGIPEELEKREREILLEKLFIEGRLVVHGHSTNGFAAQRGLWDKGGFTVFTDKRFENDSASAEKLKKMIGSHTDGLMNIGAALGPESTDNWSSLEMERENIASMITMGPVGKEEKIFREEEYIEEVPGFLRTKKVKKTRRVEAGRKKNAVPIGDFSGDKRNQEAAYELYQYFGQTEGHTYHDSGKVRTGAILEFHILLPKELAEKAFAIIQEDPLFMGEILERYDRELVAEMMAKERLPEGVGKRFLIVPEGELSRALTIEKKPMSYPKVKKIDPKYIQTVDWQAYE